jgi:hypothetical protein
MTFEQLFNHMERYIEIPEERWKLVTRVKRGISDPHAVGCYSRDQCYFEGAVDILENLEKIDFYLLMSGKLCVDELHLVKKAAKISTKLKIPKFMKDIKSYKNQLREIGIVNGIIEPPQPGVASIPSASSATTNASATTVNTTANAIAPLPAGPLPPVLREKPLGQQLYSLAPATVAEVVVAAVAASAPTPPRLRKPSRSVNDQPSEAKAQVFQEIEDIIIENNIKFENLQEYREMFEKNHRVRTMTSIEIKNYIQNEIVSSTKNTAGSTLKSLNVNEKDSNSTLCNII